MYIPILCLMLLNLWRRLQYVHQQFFPQYYSSLLQRINRKKNKFLQSSISDLNQRNVFCSSVHIFLEKWAVLYLISQWIFGWFIKELLKTFYLIHMQRVSMKEHLRTSDILNSFLIAMQPGNKENCIPTCAKTFDWWKLF